MASHTYISNVRLESHDSVIFRRIRPSWKAAPLLKKQSPARRRGLETILPRSSRGNTCFDGGETGASVMTSAVPPDQSHDPEKVSFLLKEKGENGANSNGVEARVKIVEGGKADDDSTSSGGNNNNNNNNNSDKGCLDRRCCGGCCSWKRFLTTSAVIFGLLLVVFVVSYVHYKAKYAGTAEAASADEIIARFSEDQTKVLNISGK